jgi:predicted nucleic acid-binding protein
VIVVAAGILVAALADDGPDGDIGRGRLTGQEHLPMGRAPALPLLPRCWDLQENGIFYDAAYLALAEFLDVPLLAAVERLARVSGPRCSIDVVSTN